MTTTISPYPTLPPSVFITPFSAESIGLEMAPTAGVATPTSAAFAATNSVYYYPLILNSTITVYRFFWCNGTTASTNNLQVGVYDNAGNAIVRGTSTLATGASQPQFDDVTNFQMAPGKYFMAIWGSGTTTHLLRSAPTGGRIRPGGMFQQTSQAGGLPATITFAALGTSYVPVFGLALRASP